MDYKKKYKELLERAKNELLLCGSTGGQKQWKPSNEQINALEHFVRSMGESGYASPYDNDTKLIYSLLEQLKQL